MMPDKIGGKPGSKPGLSVTVISAKPRGIPDKIGGDPSRREESDDVPVSRKETMRDVAKAIIAEVTAVKPNPDRLADHLYAFCRAADIDDPDDYEEGGEGEENEEEGN